MIIMKVPFSIFLTLTCTALSAEVPQAMLDIEASCFIDKSKIELRFEIRNHADRIIWIVPDTEPWSPSFISNRFFAEVGVDKKQTLRGPLAFGHSMKPVELPAHGLTRGAVQLDTVFPEIMQTATTQQVLLSWRWQGLASYSDHFEDFSPTARFEGSLKLISGSCSDIVIKRS